jgi:transcriptional regulator with PAS, ATPase and Fis domain
MVRVMLSYPVVAMKSRGLHQMAGIRRATTDRMDQLNKPYARFLGHDVKESIGKHCTEVVENSRMHIVARTGRPELNHMQMIRGQNIVVHRIPIKKGGVRHRRFRPGDVPGCG